VCSPIPSVFSAGEPRVQDPLLSRPSLHPWQRCRTPQTVVGGAHRPEAALVTEHRDALAALLVGLLHACGTSSLSRGLGQWVAGPPRLLAPVAELAVGQRPEPASIAVAGRALAANLGARFAFDRGRYHRRNRRVARRRLGNTGARPVLAWWPLATRTLAPRFHLLAHGRHSSSGAATNPSRITAPNPRLSFAIGPSAAHGAARSTAACQAGPGSLH